MALIQKAFSDIITFSRSSNATRVGPTGVLEYAPHNLILQSQTFDNASWTAGNATVTANAASAPDGTVTADVLTENSLFAAHRVFQSVTTTAIPYTASCYLKAGSRNWGYIRIRDSGSTDRLAFFNLATGVLGATGTGLASTIQSVGNGWYRCTATLSSPLAGSNPIVIGVSSADGTEDYTGNGTGNIYLWGAQLSVGPYALDYTPTTSAAVYGPRFDYDPVTLAARGLLIEEQRTNLVTYSETFSNAAWTKNNCTISASAAPSGENTASLLVPSSNGNANLYNAVTASSAAYTVSVYAKASGKSWVYVLTPAGSSSALAYFNVSTGVVGSTVGSVTASITPAGNGWYRCQITGTTASSYCQFGVCDADGSLTATVSGSNGAIFWGAQLEAGSFATSYIPTVAASVTRSADVASVDTLSPWYSSTEGTLFAEYDTSIAGGGPYQAELNDGTANNRITLYVSAGVQRTYVATSGAAQVDIGVGSISNNVVYKTAVAYKANDFAITVNGVSPTTDTSATIPTVNKLVLGAYNSDSLANLLNGHLRRVAYYPRRLTNAELQALTA